MDEIKKYWLDLFQNEDTGPEWWERKKAVFKDRDAKIMRISGEGQLFEKIRHSNQNFYQYLLHLSFFIKQKDQFIREEQVIPYRFQIKNGEIIEHRAVERQVEPRNEPVIDSTNERSAAETRFSYNRHAAVQYAERWWNSYNPDYRKFDVDCTNFISQCLHAGGAPMRGAPNRGEGWWYHGDNWSYSWAVAHSLRWYLSGSQVGLKGKELDSAADLLPGDVICYDFQGDGRWDHNTIVVAKDAYGMPLVNAHTSNSRHRYWSYEDSTAYTPEIQYKFFRIGE